MQRLKSYIDEYLIIVYQLIMKYKVAMTKASSKNAQKLGHREKLVLARLLLDIEESGPMQPKYPDFSKLGKDKYLCHLSYHHVACWYNENGTYKVEVYYVGSRESAPY